jgi:hypothetical protein
MKLPARLGRYGAETLPFRDTRISILELAAWAPRLSRKRPDTLQESVTFADIRARLRRTLCGSNFAR